MPRLWILLAAITLAVPIAYADVIFSESFDGFTTNSVCCQTQCTVFNIGSEFPTGYAAFGSSENQYGYCNAQINADAERSTLLLTDRRGFRIYLESSGSSQTENYLLRDLGNELPTVYIKWWERDSTTSFTGSQELFSLLDQAQSKIISASWLPTGSATVLSLGGISSPPDSSPYYFSSYDLATRYSLNSWACYEFRLDSVNREAEFFVNDQSMGIMSLPGVGTTRYLKIGGAQSGNWWFSPIEHTRDYDDIVVSTTREPCSGAIIPPSDPVCPQADANSDNRISLYEMNAYVAKWSQNLCGITLDSVISAMRTWKAGG
jgi:hypothetical protein